jgi:exopolyphosphatase / guanosine-5'-triphosphate,3'-diphosphate pyrophosphatase
MENVVPRWEWRTFGDDFGDAEQRVRSYTPENARESAEIYILAAANQDNVKIRDMLMDVKTLQQVNEDGLEQWIPVMKGSFPLPAEEVLKVLDALRVAPHPLCRGSYTLDQFMGDLVNASRRLRAIDVRKKRTGYRINDCTAEVAEVTVEGRTTRTVAIEAEDPLLVITTVCRLGLDRFTNINYPRGLKSLVRVTI